MKNYRILVYSGDVDSSVNYQGTQRWINSLELPVVSEWKEWFASDGQNAGFIKVYQNLTYLTIRGAGHMVPQYKPANSLIFFSKFLKQTL